MAVFRAKVGVPSYEKLLREKAQQLEENGKQNSELRRRVAENVERSKRVRAKIEKQLAARNRNKRG